MEKIFGFNTTLNRPEGVGTWHYVDTPIQVEREYCIKGKVPISGILNGVPFNAALIPRGNGEHYIVLDSIIRNKAGIEVGENIEMEVWRDRSERKVLIPDDFQLVLSSNPSANSYFESLALSHKKAYVDWIISAKKEVTRKNRLDKSLSLLLEKKKCR